LFVSYAGGAVMEFCPQCDKALIYRAGSGYKCPKCGYTKPVQRIDSGVDPAAITEKTASQILIIEPDKTSLQTLPTITVNCPQCENTKAAYWTHAVGTDDDVELIQLFRCTQCGHRWRQAS